MACKYTGDLVRKNTCLSPQSGTNDIAFIASIKDIVKWTKGLNVPVEEAEQVFRRPIMKFTKKFYKIEGRNNSIQGMAEFDGTGSFGKYTHQLNFSVYEDSPIITARLRELNAEKIVSVIQTNNKQFKILGKDSGLIVQTNSQDTSSEDTGGTYTINALGKASAFPDHLAVYSAELPNSVYNFELSQTEFQLLKDATKWPISAIAVGLTTTITLNDTTNNPFVDEAEIGTLVYFEDIVGTVGTDLTRGLNGKSFPITSIINNKTFTISADTTGLLYSSGGTAQ
jgi:hypothetical protein